MTKWDFFARITTVNVTKIKMPKLNKNRKIIIAVVVVLLFAGGGAWALYNKDAKPASTDSGGINYNSPTDAEKKETEQFKKDLEAKTSSSDNSPSNNQASVTMTYLVYQDNKVSSAGFINNLFEDGGTCTLTLTKGSVNVEGTSTGLQDVNKTTCPTISIDKARLQAGEWTAFLSYSSSGGSGSSPVRTINVP